jgi:hypothetical protein
MANVDGYTIEWSDADRAYLATSVAYPGPVGRGPSEMDALGDLLEALADLSAPDPEPAHG